MWDEEGAEAEGGLGVGGLLLGNITNDGEMDEEDPGSSGWDPDLLATLRHLPASLSSLISRHTCPAPLVDKADLLPAPPAQTETQDSGYSSQSQNVDYYDIEEVASVHSSHSFDDEDSPQKEEEISGLKPEDAESAPGRDEPGQLSSGSEKDDEDDDSGGDDLAAEVESAMETESCEPTNAENCTAMETGGGAVERSETIWTNDLEQNRDTADEANSNGTAPRNNPDINAEFDRIFASNQSTAASSQTRTPETEIDNGDVNGEVNSDEASAEQRLEPEESSDEDCCQPKGQLGSFLSDAAKEKYRGCRMKETFPEFRKSRPLRLNRLFGASSRYEIPNPYAHLRKRKRSPAAAAAAASEEEEPKPKNKWFFEIEVTPDQVYDDYGDFLKPKYVNPNPEPADDGASAQKQSSDAVAPWRNGPAKYWYDMINADPSGGDSFNYGLPPDRVLKDNPAVTAINRQILAARRGEVAEEEIRPLLMLNQCQWESSVVWEADSAKVSEVRFENRKQDFISGWIPTPTARSLAKFLTENNLEHRIPEDDKGNEQGSKKRKPFYSFFPPESYELLHEDWEVSVVWDVECHEFPPPAGLKLDPADQRLIPYVADDRKAPPPKTAEPTSASNEKQTAAAAAAASLKENKGMRRSKILLGKLGETSHTVAPKPPPEKSPSAETQNSLSHVKPKHRFNVSNDEYYQTTEEGSSVKNSGALIHHSTPALELMQPFFPTVLGVQRLRQFHRWPLKNYSYGPLSKPGFKPVKHLAHYIEMIRSEREAERLASGGGEMFYMRTPDDLSGRDGNLILAEFSEQHPPLMSQIGMSSKVRNYYKRGRTEQGPGRTDGGGGPPNLPYGEVVYTSQSPFLGSLKPGQCLSVLENNMYRAPIYPHAMNKRDFLIIRCREAYYIREVDRIFTVGQEYPLMEVPSPNSKRATNFQRDFLTVFIYRLFWCSTDEIRRIKMEDIKNAFPHFSESSIRKRLKLCADFKRAGQEQNWWVLKSDFRLLNEEEMRRMVSAEECCAYYSMLAAEQRLRDAGYGDKAFILDDNNDDSASAEDSKVEDEVKCAPWNTTRAFINAIAGKCLLDITGIADPTGCGEGFSYIRLSSKPNKDEEASSAAEKKRNVTGTDADLRKLPLSDARKILMKAGIPEEEIKKLTRWEVIDVIRTLSTEKAKSGGGDSIYGKFARGNKYSLADYQEKYKEECQRIFDQQNKMLASDEVLSTDDESSSDDDEEDVDEMTKNVETMMANRKSSMQLAREKEEKERKELHKMIMSGGLGKDKKKESAAAAVAEDDTDMSKYAGKVLKIYRTYKSPDGKEYTKVESVRKPEVIHTYITIRENKDVAWMRDFASIDQIKKEEQRKERRRLQDQLRRLKRNMLKGKFKTSMRGGGRGGGGGGAGRPVNPRMKCGACGKLGHMKTNRECPLFAQRYGEGGGYLPPDDQPEEESSRPEQDQLIKVEDTKIILGKGIIQMANNPSRKHQRIFPKPPRSRPTPTTEPVAEDEAGYRRHYTSGGSLRRRADPLIVLSSLLEKLIEEIKRIEGSESFHHRVSAKLAPDYHRVVAKPMDLLKMRDKCRRKLYKTRTDFIEDINLIESNSYLYNGYDSPLTRCATEIREYVTSTFREMDSKFSKLEKRINPLLDDDDQVAFSFLLGEIADKLKKIPDSQPFHVPVSKKAAPNYRQKVKNPMDLDTIKNKCTPRHAYRTIHAFLSDVLLLLSNSEAYNGVDHPLTKKATEIVNLAKLEIDLHADYLSKLEKRIFVASQKSCESTGSSPTGFSEMSGFSGTHDDVVDESSSSSSEDDGGEEEGGSEGGRNRARISNIDQFFSNYQPTAAAGSSSEMTFKTEEGNPPPPPSTLDELFPGTLDDLSQQFSEPGSPIELKFDPPPASQFHQSHFDTSSQPQQYSTGQQEYSTGQQEYSTGQQEYSTGQYGLADQLNLSWDMSEEDGSQNDDVAKMLIGDLSDSDNEEEDEDGD